MGCCLCAEPPPEWERYHAVVNRLTRDTTITSLLMWYFRRAAIGGNPVLLFACCRPGVMTAAGTPLIDIHGIVAVVSTKQRTAMAGVPTACFEEEVAVVVSAPGPGGMWEKQPLATGTVGDLWTLLAFVKNLREIGFFAWPPTAHAPRCDPLTLAIGSLPNPAPHTPFLLHTFSPEGFINECWARTAS